MDSVFTPLLAAALALMPAAAAWWSCRGLIRLADDPALPERLFATSQRRGIVTCVAVAIIVALTGRHIFWALPLMMVGEMAAFYPLRTVIYGETWSLNAYLVFFTRLYVAVFGFWILLGLGPVLASMTGPRDWMVGVCLAIALFAWQAAYGDIARRLLGSRPIVDPNLSSRFARLAAACQLKLPRFEQIFIPGGVVANAVALPSLRGSAVVFTDSLLNVLTADEVEGIAAHELAHLEYYNPSRLRRQRLLTGILIVCCAAAAPLARWYGPAAFLPYAWIVVVVIGLALQGRTRQANETASDLRAVALTGNPDALISALTKLHAIALVPRRWDTEVERRATHPSLARRIQAIREATGAALAAPGVDARFAALGDAASVGFDDRRLTWTDDDGSTHSVAYEALEELRVAASVTGDTTLIIVDRTKRRWEIPMRADDVGPTQAVLDIVDTQLAKSSPTSTRVNQIVPVRIVAALLALAALVAAQWAALLTAALALVRPAPRVLAAAAAAATSAAFLLWRDGPQHLPGQDLTVALILALIGAVLAVMAYRARQTTSVSADGKSIAVLGMAMAVVWALAIVHAGRIEALTLSNSARVWPAAAVLPCAIAAALIWQRRVAAVILAGTGLLVMTIGSRTFFDRFANDPLLVDAKRVTIVPIDSRPVAEFDVPLEAHAFQLSNDGRHVAVSASRDGRATSVLLGPAGGKLAEFDANTVHFGRADSAVLVGFGRGQTIISEVSLSGAPHLLREHRFEGLSEPHVAVDRAGRWRLVAWTGDEVVAIESNARGDLLPERRWAIDGDEYLTPLAAGPGGPIVLETRYDAVGTSLWRLRMAASYMLTTFDRESRFWLATPGGRKEIVRSRLDVRCSGVSVADHALCSASDGMRTRLVFVGSKAGVYPIVELPGDFIEVGTAPSGWMTGWWNRQATALRLDTGEAFQLAAGNATPPTHLSPADEVLGALSYESGRQIIRLYPLP